MRERDAYAAVTSPVIAATSSSCGRSATGLVTMCRASRKTVTLWQISYTSSRWCEMYIIVTPCSRSERMRANNRSMAGPSSRAVGSSRMMNLAPNDSARAISTSWRCSTLRSPASACASTSTSYVSSSSRALARSARQAIGPGRSVWRLRKRFSATVSAGMIVDFW